MIGGNTSYSSYKRLGRPSPHPSRLYTIVFGTQGDQVPMYSTCEHFVGNYSYINSQISLADFILCERGFNDAGLSLNVSIELFRSDRGNRDV